MDGEGAAAGENQISVCIMRLLPAHDDDFNGLQEGDIGIPVGEAGNHETLWAYPFDADPPNLERERRSLFTDSWWTHLNFQRMRVLMSSMQHTEELAELIQQGMGAVPALETLWRSLNLNRFGFSSSERIGKSEILK